MNDKELETTVLPQFFPARWLEDIPNIVFRYFPSSIRVGFVQREKGGYSFLLEEDFAECATSLDDLFSIACSNLSALGTFDITVARTAGGVEGFFGTIDNFMAARILLPKTQAFLIDKLGRDFLVTLPCRDWCSFWSLDQSSERQKRHADEAIDIFSSDEYNLTPDVLLCSRSEFSVYGARFE